MRRSPRVSGTPRPRSLDEAILITADTLDGLAGRLGLDPDAVRATVAEWNAACAAGRDAAFGRPPPSMTPVATPPFSAAPIWPIVSNTQGGPAHDEDQRVLDAFGAPIPNLYEAGEIGSVFGHLYLSGGNIAECFVGGLIAGEAAARAEFDACSGRRRQSPLTRGGADRQDLRFAAVKRNRVPDASADQSARQRRGMREKAGRRIALVLADDLERLPAPVIAFDRHRAPKRTVSRSAASCWTSAEARRAVQ